MVERLFSSRALFKTLALLFEYPDEPLNPRSISRHTGTGMKGVLREIRKLEEMGVLHGWNEGQNRYSLLVQGHPMHDCLRVFFAEVREIYS